MTTTFYHYLIGISVNLPSGLQMVQIWMDTKLKITTLDEVNGYVKTHVVEALQKQYPGWSNEAPDWPAHTVILAVSLLRESTRNEVDA